MKLHYVKIYSDWDNLKENDVVTFNLPTVILEYKVYFCFVGTWWLTGSHCNNSKIFKELGLKKKDFVKSVVGYTCIGGFPELKSIDDLKKVIIALNNECEKKFGKPTNNESADYKKGKEVLPTRLKEGDYIKELQSIDTVKINNPYKDLKAPQELLLNEYKIETPKEELNLFPTKKYYQLNFNY